MSTLFCWALETIASSLAKFHCPWAGSKLGQVTPASQRRNEPNGTDGQLAMSRTCIPKYCADTPNVGSGVAGVCGEADVVVVDFWLSPQPMKKARTTKKIIEIECRRACWVTCSG